MKHFPEDNNFEKNNTFRHVTPFSLV
jgi:hypothetical protein